MHIGLDMVMLGMPIVLILSCWYTQSLGIRLQKNYFGFRTLNSKILWLNISRHQQPHVFENTLNKAHLFKNCFISKVFLTKQLHIYRVSDKKREH